MCCVIGPICSVSRGERVCVCVCSLGGFSGLRVRGERGEERSRLGRNRSCKKGFTLSFISTDTEK